MIRLRAELRRCWPSLVSAALISIAYQLLGRHNAWGWAFVAVSNTFMLVVAKRSRQWGLLFAVFPLAGAIQNFAQEMWS